jgi:SAM-dependent methyltransferase
MNEISYAVRALFKGIAFIFVPVALVLTAFYYPHDTDATPARSRSAAQFYESAYLQQTANRGVDYEATAKAAAESFGVADVVRKFVADHGLERKKVLDVGSGRGYLQDMVDDYTGLDLSPSVARHYHKPFVVGSATSMPFPDKSFDAIWTVWVMEHIPEPEKAFREMRRVVKPGGLLFLYVAWNCTPWAADGFDVRPYSDFNWRGKFVKATVPLRRWSWFNILHGVPVRSLRLLSYNVRGRREKLHFQRVEPNYDVYWEPDSDAAISLDSFETYLWFRAAGDDCLNCDSAGHEMRAHRDPMIIRVRE